MVLATTMETTSVMRKCEEEVEDNYEGWATHGRTTVHGGEDSREGSAKGAELATHKEWTTSVQPPTGGLLPAGKTPLGQSSTEVECVLVEVLAMSLPITPLKSLLRQQVCFMPVIRFFNSCGSNTFRGCNIACIF